MLMLYTNVFSVLGDERPVLGERGGGGRAGGRDAARARQRRVGGGALRRVHVFWVRRAAALHHRRAGARVRVRGHARALYGRLLGGAVGWLLLGETPGAAEACGIAAVAMGSASAFAANLAEKKKKAPAES